MGIRHAEYASLENTWDADDAALTQRLVRPDPALSQLRCTKLRDVHDAMPGAFFSTSLDNHPCFALILEISM